MKCDDYSNSVIWIRNYIREVLYVPGTDLDDEILNSGTYTLRDENLGDLGRGWEYFAYANAENFGWQRVNCNK